MDAFSSGGMKYDGKQLYILDQTVLPQEEAWLACNDAKTLVALIRRLAVRGAPAIGISAALLLGLLAERGVDRDRLRADATILSGARPTAVNLRSNVDRVMTRLDDADYQRTMPAEALSIFREDVEQCERMARYGADLLGRRSRVLTHCNTGSLVTAGCGTALGVISRAHEAGKDIFVWVDETRPLLQGGRLTAWECLKNGIPHRIICDNAAASLMRQGQVDAVLVGSDRIAVNGDFANKIGTYPLAVLARYHDIPFYVVAPQTTVDPSCPDGTAIPIENREESEVKGVRLGERELYWGPEGSRALNPAFDVTPAELVSRWVLDTGVFTRKQLEQPRWWLGKRG